MRSYLSTPPATASAVMRPKFLTQSHTFSRNLSCISRESLRSLYISKNRTKRQLLPAACSKNPTAIRPVPMHADRDPRRRRQSSPSHKSRKSQFKQMPTISRTCAPACQTLHPPPKGLQPNPHSPAATTRASFASLPSAVMRPKFLAQSHTFSRKLSCNARASPLPVNPSIRPKSTSNVNPVCNRNAAGESNNCIVAVSPVLTQNAIRNSAPNLLLPPCKSLDHRISFTHRRKTKATADHLCTLTNVYCLTEQPQLQDHNAAAPDASLCPHPQYIFQRAKKHMNSRGNSRHFAPI